MINADTSPGEATQSCSNMPISGLMEKERLLKMVGQLKALAHPVRLRMIELTRAHGGEICVCEFEKHFEVKQPTISHHLKILRDAGLLHSRQEGTWVHQSIEPVAFAELKKFMVKLSS